MKSTILAVLTTLLLVSFCSCGNKTANRQKTTTEPTDTADAIQTTDCSFSKPDTSVAGITLRNAESMLAVLGKDVKPEGDRFQTHITYSSDGKQLLGLTVYPGDQHFSVSLFSVSYLSKPEENIQQLASKEFETEKGIKLGIGKDELVKKLGSCYTTTVSADGLTELCYRIELPNDSETNLLQTHNMPIYYAIYRLANDKLESFEFGFEYP